MRITASDAVILMLNLLIANEKSQIGFEDANRTLSQVYTALADNKTALVPISAVESALWAANLLDERGAFVHMRPLKFQNFVNSIVGQNNFSSLHNYIIDEDKIPNPVKRFV
jgi:hypothetical protein